MTLWAAIALSGLATFLTRALPLMAALPLPATGAVRRYIDALPTAIIAALAGAAIFAPSDQLTGGAEPVAAVVVLLIARWRRNLLLAVVAGTAVIALLRAIT